MDRDGPDLRDLTSDRSRLVLRNDCLPGAILDTLTPVEIRGHHSINSGIRGHHINWDIWP